MTHYTQYRNNSHNTIVRKRKVKVTQSCVSLCDLMDYTVHGILQARILEWIAFPFSRDSDPGLLHYRQILYQLSHKGNPRKHNSK